LESRRERWKSGSFAALFILLRKDHGTYAYISSWCRTFLEGQNAGMLTGDWYLDKMVALRAMT